MSTATEQAKPPTRGISLATWTVVSVATGIALGVLLGDVCRILEPLGDVFVDLLQMTVLPYVVVAVVSGVGQLSATRLRRTMVAAGAVVVSLWSIGAIFIVLLPSALPDWRAGSFFSSTQLKAPAEVGLLRQFFTPNVFNALAIGLVPAIVVFSFAFGLALNGLKQGEAILEPCRVARRALERINHVILYSVPVGVFAISASTAGTIRFDELTRLQGYFVMMTMATAALVLALLPMLVAAITPLSYSSVLRASRPIVITAFVTGKVLIVLPLIMQAARELLAGEGIDDDATGAEIDSIVPTVYAFPHLGRLMAIAFVPFGAWFVGRPFTWGEYPGLLFSGLAASFGNAVLAIPFLLDSQQLPADLFQLFVASSVVCGRLSDAVGAMHFIVVATITPCLILGRTEVRPARLGRYVLVGGFVVGLSMLAVNSYVSATLNGVESKSDALLRMRSLVAEGDFVVHRPGDVVPETPRAERGVERIRRTGVLRIGYLPDNLPFTFFNADDELVGFDVDLGRILAEDLGVRPEFAPFDPDRLDEQLDRGDFDLAISGIAVTPTRLLRMSFSESYLDATLAFVVKDHLRRDFATRESIAELGDVRIAVPRSNFFVHRLGQILPDARVESIDSPREFFEDGEFDAMLVSAEAGSAWTIEYPYYTTVVPKGEDTTQPLAIAVPLGDDRMVELTDRWVELFRKRQHDEALRAHWIEGRDETTRSPRWSVIRNVLGWIE